jgi:integrase
MASVTKRETSRGARYDVRYRDLTGRVRTKTFRRRADADRFARSVEVDKDRGLFIDPKLARTPLADVAAKWLASNPGKRGGSWQRDEVAVRLHIVPTIGHRAVGSLTPGDVQGLVNDWAANRAARTVHRDFGVLRAILNYAVANDMVGRSPARGIGLPQVRAVRPHIVTPDELERLAHELGGLGALGPMVYLGTVSGLRWGEVAGLRVGQLDVEDSAVRVVEIVVRGRKGAVMTGEPKSAASRRTVAIPEALTAMLLGHMAAKELTEDDRSALLFTAPGGGMLRYSNWLRRRWYPAAVAAGVGVMVEDERTRRKRYQGLGFHDLRRASATGLVAEGVDIKTAQAMLGHSDSRLTLELYAQAVTAQGKAAAEAMGGRFLQAPRDGRAMDGQDGKEATEAENEEEAP